MKTYAIPEARWRAATAREQEDFRSRGAVRLGVPARRIAPDGTPYLAWRDTRIPDADLDARDTLKLSNQAVTSIRDVPPSWARDVTPTTGRSAPSLERIK